MLVLEKCIMKNYYNHPKIIPLCFVLFLAIGAGFWGFAIYVAWHFIKKHW